MKTTTLLLLLLLLALTAGCQSRLPKYGLGETAYLLYDHRRPVTIEYIYMDESPCHIWYRVGPYFPDAYAWIEEDNLTKYSLR